MPVTLPPLPYAIDALTPHLNKENLELHYKKHHNAYVTKLNELKPDASDATLQQLVISSDGAVFNQAAQVWNHNFYWKSMVLNGGGEPSGQLNGAIIRDFGSFHQFKEAFINATLTQFGSGWVWLVVQNDVLSVTTTTNADLPLKHRQQALLTCDVWEHAYYPTYKNLRAAYVEAFLSHLANWGFAADNFEKSA